jgi:DNA-directed RNA polymerase specialized sigma24 family protein
MNLDELIKSEVLGAADKERASQILKAVEGLKIREATELLEACIGALGCLRICL